MYYQCRIHNKRINKRKRGGFQLSRTLIEEEQKNSLETRVCMDHMQLLKKKKKKVHPGAVT